MREVPWNKLVNLGEFFDQLKKESGQSRAPKGIQDLERVIDRGIQRDSIPAYNVDGPGSVALHAVREGGSMGFAPELDPTVPGRLPAGFLREAHVPVGYIVMAAHDTGLYRGDFSSRGHQKTLSAALQKVPDHIGIKDRLQPMNGAGNMPYLPEGLVARNAADGASDVIVVEPSHRRSRDRDMRAGPGA